jgi:hypothetical protein
MSANNEQTARPGLRAKSAPQGASGPLLQTTSAVLQLILKDVSLKSADANVVSTLLRRLADVLEADGAKELSLFGDFAPARAAPAEAVALPSASVSARTTKGNDHAPARVLEDNETYWSSTLSPDQDFRISLPSPRHVVGVEIRFRARYLPSKVALLAQPHSQQGEGKADYTPLVTIGGKQVRENLYIHVPESAQTVASKLKLVFDPPDSSAPEPSTQIVRLRIFAKPEQQPVHGATESIKSMAKLFEQAAEASEQSSSWSEADKSAVGDASLRGLLRLATASGSLDILLRACTSLLSSKLHYLSPETFASANKLAAALFSQIHLVSKRATEMEYVEPTNRLAIGGAAGTSTYGPVAAAFDPACCSSGVTVKNEGKSVTSTSGSSNWAALDIGPFASGKASWEFRLDEDTSSQCSCFGALTKPVTDPNYESSRQMLMLRAYNGHRYAFGSLVASGTDEDKVAKGAVVRFDLDMDEGDGVLRYSIDGRSRGIGWTGLRGKELWPAVAFYSTSRVVSIVSAEAPYGTGVAKRLGGSSATESEGPVVGAARVQPGTSIGLQSSASLSNMQEAYSHVAPETVLGRGGDLGFGPEAQRKVKVRGTPYSNTLSMCPRDATVTATAGEDDEEALDDYDEEHDVRADGAYASRAGSAANEANAGAGAEDYKAMEASDALAESKDEGPRLFLQRSEADSLQREAVDGELDQDDGAAQSPRADGYSDEDDAGAVGDGDDPIAQALELRRENAIREAIRASKRCFRRTATAVWWLGGRYETFTGMVALADSATPEQRADPAASPVVFEVYDGERDKLLWASHPISAVKVAPLEFSIDVLDVAVLRLCVRAVAGNKNAHAVWLNPSLLECTEWECGGWRNDRAAMTCALCGAQRKKGPTTTLFELDLPRVAPLTAESASPNRARLQDPRCPQRVAVRLLFHAALLAQHHVRYMRCPSPLTQGKGGVAQVDILAPFALEATASVMETIQRLLRLRHVHTDPNLASDDVRQLLLADCVAASHTIQAAVIRRCLYSGVHVQKDFVGGFAMTFKIPLRSFVANDEHSDSAVLLRWLTEKHILRFPQFCRDVRSLCSGVRAVEDVVDLSGVEFLDRAGGVLEVQLDWPYEGIDSAGAVVQLETLLILLQLHARNNSWPTRVLGYWPAKVFLLVQVPARPGLKAFLEHDFPAILQQVDLEGCYKFPDGIRLPSACSVKTDIAMPLFIHPVPFLDRAARMALEPGVGAIRAHIHESVRKTIASAVNSTSTANDSPQAFMDSTRVVSFDSAGDAGAAAAASAAPSTSSASSATEGAAPVPASSASEPGPVSIDEIADSISALFDQAQHK